MLKIFRIGESDPLLWQLSYIDSEISKIIQSKYTARPNQSRQVFERQRAAQHQQQRDISNLNPNKDKPDLRQKVARMQLEADEMCCVCHETMKEDENLTFCKFGCGRNIHIECIEVWVKHKLSNGQKITCPLCRTDWGPNALEDLK